MIGLNPVRHGAWGMVLLMGGLHAFCASAKCTISKPGFVAQDVQMDMGQVTILPSTPVGGVIKELTAQAVAMPRAGTSMHSRRSPLALPTLTRPWWRVSGYGCTGIPGRCRRTTPIR